MPSRSTLSTLVVALLAVQASAGPAHGHRRHHARHGKRACRAKVGPGAAAAAAGSAYGHGNGNGVNASDATGAGAGAGASAGSSDGTAIIIPPSASGSLTGSETASTIGHELAATGAPSAAPSPTQGDPNNPDPVSGFIASSAGQTGSGNGLIDLSISLGIGHGQSEYPPAALPTSLASTTASYGSEVIGSIITSASNTSLSSPASSAVVVAPIPSASASAPVTTTPGPSNGKRVFAHYMVGIVSQFAQGDWEKEMRIAKAHAIDGFALNIGVDPYTQEQLDHAYAAAEAVDFDVFISFDFNWFSVSDVTGVSTIFKRYMDKPKQYKVDGKPFVSTFIGDGFDWGAVEQQVGKPIYSVPFYEPTAQNAELPSLSGLFSWSAWPGQLGNVPVKQSMSDDRDLLYMSYTDPIQKDYMAPVSPWFFTHFGPEVPYSKNWLFYSETLWYDRWEQILKMQDNLRFLEIVTWNDYGESHYIGPLDTPHSDDGSGIYTKGLDHTAHLEFAVPYIKAFKSGSKTPIIEQDMLVYWYRPHLKSASCDSTDNCGKKPDGWDMVEDQVFVATMTKNGGSFTVTSGGNSVVTNQAGAGVQVFKIPMGVGEQKFTFTANGANGGDTSTIPISADCWNGVYNYNYHSGSIKL